MIAWTERSSSICRGLISNRHHEFTRYPGADTDLGPELGQDEVDGKDFGILELVIVRECGS